ncbi:MAG: ribonuclease P protein component [Candidatus Cloacimonetes bacterium]|jgi:ribonuclease P protein component|nr:ribonuclease P protein component [Candidatus Cloacimonadota bacterium]HNZ06360.1 ribonuclease P protein component [Candidatus Cloacimonadota bacterium]HOH79148.1 ribonuclease P protein component [Candidatus Cloacimonadota bacterium]HPN41791.1 ribonuclease P protein component [Candidatus Cloacimonadota bacterium]
MARLITRHSEYGSLFPPLFYVRSEHFSAAVQVADQEFALGITIGKKIGKAVRRNQLRRRIKAWVRLADSTLPKRFKLNLIARPGAGELSWPQLCDQLQALVQKLGNQ